MRKFDYNQLLKDISGIEIKLEGDEVATYYNKRQVSRKKVSSKYEIFDFRPFVIRCINEVRKSYEIEFYTLNLVGGRQEIRLVSKAETIEGEEFRRTFYLLNSSDKSRALSFSYGLKHNNFHYISKKGTIYKKHYTGITKYVEDVDLDDTVFVEQIAIIKKMIGDTIFMSNVQKVITESEILKKSKTTLRNNFYKFRDRLYLDSKGILDEENREKLRVIWWKKEERDFIEEKNDFSVDSFLVFKTYLKLFTRRDSAEIKRESERISKMSVLQNRKGFIEELLFDL